MGGVEEEEEDAIGWFAGAVNKVDLSGKLNVVIVDASLQGGANFVDSSVLVVASTNQTSFFFFDDLFWDFPGMFCLLFIVYKMFLKLWIEVNCVHYTAQFNLKEIF